jgi:hypothetical protein
LPHGGSPVIYLESMPARNRELRDLTRIDHRPAGGVAPADAAADARIVRDRNSVRARAGRTGIG